LPDRALGPLRSARVEHVIVLAALAGLFSFLFAPTLGAYFHVVEEHHILRQAGTTWSEWAGSLRQDVELFGRFRPLYYFFHFLKLLLLGPRPILLHVLTTTTGVATCFLFYRAARGIGADVVSSAVFVLLFAATGTHTAIWYHLYTPQETLGMLLTSLSVWAVVRAGREGAPSPFDRLALVAMAAAALAKENFFLLIPAILLMRWSLECWFQAVTWATALQRLRRPLLAGIAVLAAVASLVTAVVVNRPGSYGASRVSLDWSVLDPRRLWPLLSETGLALLAPAFIVALTIMVVCAGGSRFLRPFVAAGLAILAAWLLPQVVLYGGDLHERYVFPAIIAPAASMGLALSFLRARGGWVGKAAWAGLLVWLAPTLSEGVARTTEAASRFAADARSVRRMLEVVAERVALKDVVVSVVDTGTGYGFEAAYALPLYARDIGSFSRFYIWPMPSQAVQSPIHVAAKDRAATDHGYPPWLRADRIGAVLLMQAPADLDTLPEWFLSRDWQEVIFRESYHAFVATKLAFETRGEAVHRLLLPGSSGTEVPGDHP
jgi:hypothetical protein